MAPRRLLVLLVAGCAAEVPPAPPPPLPDPPPDAVPARPTAPLQIAAPEPTADSTGTVAPNEVPPDPPPMAGPATCFNKSTTDCNVPGTTLKKGSAFVDASPPAGFVQCAGFVNTAGDDVAARFFDDCLGAIDLRVRVFSSDDTLEEDIILTGGSAPTESWANFDYIKGESSAEKRTHWGATTFFTTTDGRDACMKQAAPNGPTFGSGNASVAIIAGGNRGADEYRISCGGADLPGRRIAIYRGARHALPRAR